MRGPSSSGEKLDIAQTWRAPGRPHELRLGSNCRTAGRNRTGSEPVPAGCTGCSCTIPNRVCMRFYAPITRVHTAVSK